MFTNVLLSTMQISAPMFGRCVCVVCASLVVVLVFIPHATFRAPVENHSNCLSDHTWPVRHYLEGTEALNSAASFCQAAHCRGFM